MCNLIASKYQIHLYMYYMKNSDLYNIGELFVISYRQLCRGILFQQIGLLCIFDKHWSTFTYKRCKIIFNIK